jgi:ABC-type transporter Mla subunit MlaD
MQYSSDDRVAGSAPELERSIADVEQLLSALADSLRGSNAQAIVQHADELHRALAVAVHRVAQAARSGGVPGALRRRLARVSAQIAAHRDALARAIEALDRAIDVLLPNTPSTSLHPGSG